MNTYPICILSVQAYHLVILGVSHCLNPLEERVLAVYKHCLLTAVAWNEALMTKVVQSHLQQNMD